MTEKKVDLLKDMLEEIGESMTNFLRKSGINGRVQLIIKPDKNFPNNHYTREEILKAVNELSMSHYGVNIQDRTAKETFLYRRIFFKIFKDMGYKYKTLIDIIDISQVSYLQNIRALEDHLYSKDPFMIERYQEVIDKLNQKYRIEYERDDEDH